MEGSFASCMKLLIIQFCNKLLCLISAVFLIVATIEQPVKIKLTDVNDEEPRFVNVPRPFLATVSQNAPPGTSVYQLMSRDDDKDSILQYNLESGELYILKILYGIPYEKQNQVQSQKRLLVRVLDHCLSFIHQM